LSCVPQSPSSHNPLWAQDLNRECVAAYRRVSSDEQTQVGTMQNQIELARRYCGLHQLPIAKSYADADMRWTDLFLQAQYHATEQVEVFGAAVGESGVLVPGPGRKNTFFPWLHDTELAKNTVKTYRYYPIVCVAKCMFRCMNASTRPPRAPIA
jgi:hypothetical protein